jgi:protein-tyrosine-phosphatase
MHPRDESISIEAADSIEPTPPPEEAAAPPRFEIVFLCGANRFRGPLAEAISRRLLDRLEVQVVSFAASGDHKEMPPLPVAVEVAGGLGVELAQHRSRAMSPGALRGSDLVIGFERRHIDAAVSEGAASPDKTFLLTQLPALLEAAGVNAIHPRPSPRDIVARLDPARRLVALTREYGPVRDPAGGPQRIQEATAFRVVELVIQTMSMVFDGAVDDERRVLNAQLAKLSGNSRRRFVRLRMQKPNLGDLVSRVRAAGS